MKIATWNIERLKHISHQKEIEQICSDLRADILVLTESDHRVSVGEMSCYDTDALPAKCEIVPGKIIKYKASERRVAVYSKYRCIRRIDTFDNRSAIATELELPKGKVIIYGVIIGLLGNREANFKEELAQVVNDIRRISKLGNLIVCGDFNCSFSDGYYFTKHGRETLQEVFDECAMTIVTAGCRECIDHIAVSNELIKDRNRIEIYEWNQDKSLSDHKGIMVTI